MTLLIKSEKKTYTFSFISYFTISKIARISSVVNKIVSIELVFNPIENNHSIYVYKHE